MKIIYRQVDIRTLSKHDIKTARTLLFSSNNLEALFEQAWNANINLDDTINSLDSAKVRDILHKKLLVKLLNARCGVVVKQYKERWTSLKKNKAAKQMLRDMLKDHIPQRGAKAKYCATATTTTTSALSVYPQEATQQQQSYDLLDSDIGGISEEDWFRWSHVEAKGQVSSDTAFTTLSHESEGRDEAAADDDDNDIVELFCSDDHDEDDDIDDIDDIADGNDETNNFDDSDMNIDM